MAASFRRTRGRNGGGSDWASGLAAKLRETLNQAGAVREVLERGAREGASRLQHVRTSRQRDQLLAELGAAIVELVQRGEIDASELPEIQPLLTQLAELDAAGGRAARDRDEPVWSPRERFDERRPGAAPPVDDDDLADFMHPDDVPGKPPSR